MHTYTNACMHTHADMHTHKHTHIHTRVLQFFSLKVSIVHYSKKVVETGSGLESMRSTNSNPINKFKVSVAVLLNNHTSVTVLQNNHSTMHTDEGNKYFQKHK